jgi:hypothetical protein
MADYIPRPDADFSTWFKNFENKTKLTPATFGLVAADIVPITAALADWDAKLLAHTDADTTAQAARVSKDGSRATAELLIRPLVRRIQASPATDDTDRETIGIPIPGANTAPSGPPTSHPMAAVHCERLRHIISWIDSVTNRKAKPLGVLGAELWMALTVIGAPTPTDPAAFDFVALDTNSPYINEFPAADGGKNAHYILRWVRADHQKGPWSETVSCTVTV